jgi:hypothetical protein
MKFLILLGIIFTVSSVTAAQFAKETCPEVKVVGPAGVAILGGSVTFTAEVGGQQPTDLRYIWNVRGGELETGQGTSRISGRSKIGDGGISSDFAEVVAEVNIVGLSNECDANASGIALVAPLSDDILIDQFGRVSWNEERGRLDVYFAELSNNPKQVGVIVIETPKKYGFDPGKKRIRRIFQHVDYRKFDGTRLIFKVCMRDAGATKFYRVPADSAHWESSEECRVFSRSEL